MSIQKIIQESVSKNPMGLKEALEEELRARVALALEAKMEEVELDEADAVVTHKWYSVKHWKDGSDHFDNLDDHLRGHDYKHAAKGNTAKNRPDHHIGIPVKAKSAIAYMEKHAKPITEEVEQIDEISKSTLSSYVKKASADQYFKGQDAQYHDNKAMNAEGPFSKETKKKHYALAAKANLKASNRDTGISRAVDRLTKEEVEQIDELKKSTLASYVKKAAGVAHRNTLPNVMRDRMTAVSMGDKEWYKQSGRIADNRSKGIQRAADRLAKE